MKFQYQGEYTTFMGRVFQRGRPVDITDRGTISALKRRSDFTEVQEAVNEEKKEAPATQILKRPVLTLRKNK